MIKKIKQILKVKELRNKIFFVIALLIVFRLAANVPIPGVDSSQLEQFFSENQMLGLMNVFSGGGLSNISIVLLGVGPYITASIVMQLLTMIFPRLDQIHKEEGEAGRQRFNMWTRWITVPFAAISTFGMISLLKSQGVMGDLSAFDMFSVLVVATAGTVFLMWLGELITEKGIGNGVSIIIFAGIVASLPSGISKTIATFDSTDLFGYLLFIIVGIITIAGVVVVNEGHRNIPISYAKRVRGDKMQGGTSTHLPLKVNQAGVIPIIFAVSIMLFPGVAANLLMNVENQFVADTARWISNLFSNQLFYGVVYFLMVLLFTYFYTAIVFDPNKIAENIQKQGGFIPGIRPGAQTSEYLGRIINRITLPGALFLGLMAVLPLIIKGITGISTMSVGGTSILIAVSVIIEIVKQVEGQMVMRDYEGF